MADVQSELAEKRRRLEKMRQQRMAAQQGGAAAPSASAAPAGARPASGSTAGGGTAGMSAAERLAKMRADREARAARAADAGSAGSPPPARVASPGGVRAGIATSADLLNRVSAVTGAEAARIRRESRPLKIEKPGRLQWELAPQGKADQYQKQCQTDPIDVPGFDGAASPLAASPVGSPQRKQDFRRLVGSGMGGGEQSAEGGEPVDAGSPGADAEFDIPEAPGLSDDAKEQIIRTDRFKRFFDNATFLVQRALRDDDLMVPGDSDASDVRVSGGGGDQIIRRLTLSDTKLTKNCPVTGVDFNSYTTGNPELFLASYYKRADGVSAIADVEGQVLIWSMKVPERPYQKLVAPCDVAKAMYDKYNGSLVLGSMYNGQICIWDTREGERPVQLTPLTMEGHTHPVFGMEVVGTANSHSLVTLSADGRMCTWQLEKLQSPVDHQNLSQMVDVGGTMVPKDIQATSLGFRDMEASKYFVGSDNGLLFAGNRSSSNASPEALEGHTSPITSLHSHPVNPGSHEDFADLILTCSMDWTCKLWMPAKSNKPLFSFDEYIDFVYDVKWNPEHPAVFASVDGAGMLSVYHLTESMETPIGKAQVSQGEKQRACSHLAWTGDGRFIGVGDAAGEMSIWQVSSKVAEPAGGGGEGDDWRRLARKLQEINAV